MNASPVDANQVEVDRAFRVWKSHLEREIRRNTTAAKIEYWAKWCVLLAVAGLAWRYYQAHLQYSLGALRILGVPISLLTLIGFARGWAPSGVLADNSRALVQRILTSRRAWQHLGIAFCALAGVNLCTASIFVESSNRATKAIEVWVRNAPTQLEERIRVAEGESQDGRHFLFRGDWLGGRTPEFEVREPAGWEVKPEVRNGSLTPWSSLCLRFPDDFQRVEYYVLRIVPVRGLLGIPQYKAGRKASNYRLTVLVDGRAAEQTLEVSYDSIYVGESDRAIETEWGREEETLRRESLRRLLTEESANLTTVAVSVERLAGRPWVRGMASGLRSGAKVEARIKDDMGAVVGRAKEITLGPRIGIYEMELELDE